MATLHTVSERPKGVVDPATARKTFRLARYYPSEPLAPFVDHYWLVEWDLRGKPPYTQRTLPYPCVHLVFDAGRTAIFGVTTGAFEYELKETGRVLGIRFAPGAFRALLGRPVRTITDKIIPLTEVFPWNESTAEHSVLAAADDAHMVAAAEALLLPALPHSDPQVAHIGRILKMIESDSMLTRVQDIATHAGMSMRSLQQLFGDYVGVSPKWVIRRYRLHDAADRIARGDAPDLAALAQALGYFDQAHFTADFQKLIGKPPAEYRRSQQAGEG